MIWLAGSVSLILVVLEIIGLVDLARNRHTMKTWQLAVWALAILALPVVGLFSYLLWRISRSDALVNAMEFNDTYGDKDTKRPLY